MDAKYPVGSITYAMQARGSQAGQPVISVLFEDGKKSISSAELIDGIRSTIPEVLKERGEVPFVRLCCRPDAPSPDPLAWVDEVLIKTMFVEPFPLVLMATGRVRPSFDFLGEGVGNIFFQILTREPYPKDPDLRERLRANLEDANEIIVFLEEGVDPEEYVTGASCWCERFIHPRVPKANATNAPKSYIDYQRSLAYEEAFKYVMAHPWWSLCPTALLTAAYR